MPDLTPIPQEIISDYTKRKNSTMPIPESKLPQRYKRKSSLFLGHVMGTKSSDPYANILNDLDKLKSKFDTSRKSKNKIIGELSDSENDSWSDLDEFVVSGKSDDNPILRSHVEMSRKLKVKKDILKEPSKPIKRYLPDSMFSAKNQFDLETNVY